MNSFNLIKWSPLMVFYLYYKYNSYFNFNYFDNKTILITGGSSGIGKAIIQLLASKTKSKIITLARSFTDNKKSRIEYYKCDCSKYGDVLRVYNQVNQKVDIIIHCAGAGDWKFLNEMTISEVNNCLNAPLKAAINVTYLFLPNLIKRNIGNITFVQSPVILQPWSSCTMYSVSRFGMRGLSESLRADLFHKKINITEVILGRTSSNYFNTNKTANQRFPWIGKLIREIKPNEAALAILWAIQKGKQYYYYPFMLRIIVYLQYMFPWLVRRLTFLTSFY